MNNYIDIFLIQYLTKYFSFEYKNIYSKTYKQFSNILTERIKDQSRNIKLLLLFFFFLFFVFFFYNRWCILLSFFSSTPTVYFFSLSLVFRIACCVCVEYSYHHCSHTTPSFILYIPIARSPLAQGRVYSSVYTNNDSLIISCSSSSSSSFFTHTFIHIFIKN